MNNFFNLFVKTGKVLECFRSFKNLKKKKYTQYILDDEWFKNPFINKPRKNLSSATSWIIFRYMTSIILFFCQMKEKYKKIRLNIYVNSEINIDVYTKKVLKVLKDLLDIEIIIIKNHDISQKESANFDNLGVSCCRGFYNEFKVEWDNIYYIIHIIHSVSFYKIDCSLNLWEKGLKLAENLEEKKLLNLNAYSYFIRSNKSVALKYLRCIILNSSNRFEKINLIAFFILRSYGKEEALKFLESKFSKKDFLKLNFKNTYCNLLAKNYASICSDYVLVKRIYKKCYKYSKSNIDLAFDLLRVTKFNKRWKKLFIKMNKYGYYDNRVLKWIDIGVFDDWFKLSYIIFNYFLNNTLDFKFIFKNNRIAALSLKFLGKEV